MIKACSVIILLGVSLIARSQGEILGFWEADEGNAKIEVYKQDQVHYAAKIVSLAEPNDKKGRPLMDTKNPDKTKRNRPLVGLTIVKDLIYLDNKWLGTLYTPRFGKTTEGTLQLMDDGRLKVTGSVRGFSRDKYWERMPKNDETITND